MGEQTKAGSQTIEAIAKERADAVLRVLSLEYQALQTELRDRMGSRFQTLAIVAGAAGLVAGFAPANSGIPDGLLYAGAAVIALCGLVSWLSAGRRVVQLSTRIAKIEWDISGETRSAYGIPDDVVLLDWETSFQENRSVLASRLQGPGWHPRRGRRQTSSPTLFTGGPRP